MLHATARAAPDIIPCLGSRTVWSPASLADRGQELGRDLPAWAVPGEVAWLVALEAEHCRRTQYGDAMVRHNYIQGAARASRQRDDASGARLRKQMQYGRVCGALMRSHLGQGDNRRAACNAERSALTVGALPTAVPKLPAQVAGAQALCVGAAVGHVPAAAATKAAHGGILKVLIKIPGSQ